MTKIKILQSRMDRVTLTKTVSTHKSTSMHFEKEEKIYTREWMATNVVQLVLFHFIQNRRMLWWEKDWWARFLLHSMFLMWHFTFVILRSFIATIGFDPHTKWEKISQGFITVCKLFPKNSHYIPNFYMGKNCLSVCIDNQVSITCSRPFTYRCF